MAVQMIVIKVTEGDHAFSFQVITRILHVCKYTRSWLSYDTTAKPEVAWLCKYQTANQVYNHTSEKNSTI